MYALDSGHHSIVVVLCCIFFLAMSFHRTPPPLCCFTPILSSDRAAEPGDSGRSQQWRRGEHSQSVVDAVADAAEALQCQFEKRCVLFGENNQIVVTDNYHLFYHQLIVKFCLFVYLFFLRI
jgi:hypothetical protein